MPALQRTWHIWETATTPNEGKRSSENSSQNISNHQCRCWHLSPLINLHGLTDLRCTRWKEKLPERVNKAAHLAHLLYRQAIHPKIRQASAFSRVGVLAPYSWKSITTFWFWPESPGFLFEGDDRGLCQHGHAGLWSLGPIQHTVEPHFRPILFTNRFSFIVILFYMILSASF